MLIDFTEYELETIANAMEDYIQYDDEKLDTELLFGGLSVAERVNSIQIKIDNVIVYYVTNLYLTLHLNFLYLHLNALALRFGIIYSSLSRMD